MLELLSMTLEELVKRSGIEKKLVEDVITGCVTPIQEQGKWNRESICSHRLLLTEF